MLADRAAQAGDSAHVSGPKRVQVRNPEGDSEPIRGECLLFRDGAAAEQPFDDIYRIVRLRWTPISILDGLGY
jgi:hypothetical protein